MRAFAASLALCLDRKSPGQAKWKINLEAIANCSEHLFDFEKYGEYKGPCLMLVGRNSTQFEIENHTSFYSNVFPNIIQDSIQIIENAGHWLHVEQKNETIERVSKFLQSIDSV